LIVFGQTFDISLSNLIKKTQKGKMKIFTLWLLSFVYVLSMTNGAIISQGNIIYIKSDRQATINPVMIHFHKSYDLRTIDQCLKTLDDFYEAYEEFCMTTLLDNYVHPEPVHIRKITFREAQFKCYEYDSQLPEIKNEEQATFLVQQMKQYNITKTMAGLAYRDEHYVYMSDGEKASYTPTKLCSNCTIIQDLSIEDFTTYIKPQGPETHFYYEITPSSKLYISVEGHLKDKPCPGMPIICFKQRAAIPTTLKALAKHTCLRDQQELATMNDNLKTEVALFHNPSKRQKRAIGLIGAGIGAGYLGIETLTSLIHDLNPLSIMGKGIANIFGFATAQDMKLTKKQLEAHSKALQDLAVNQKLLIEGYKAVQADIAMLKQANMQMEHDVAVLFANLDNKLAIRNLQNLLQMTLLRMSQAIASAIQHQTSPYAFGVKDLQNLTTVFRYQGIPLTDDLNDVYTTMAIVDDMYTFIFSAPILTQENDMFLYEIRDLPIYNNRIQYRLNITNRFIGINFNTDEYVILTNNEYSNCMSSHLCMAAASFLTIGKDSPCEVLSLKYKTQQCDLIVSDQNMQNFLTYGNVTYYSLPYETEVQVICKDAQASVTQIKQLYGVGELQTAPGCNININKQVSIRPSYVLSRHNLEGESFFKFLQMPNMPLHKYPTTTKAPNTTLSPIKFRDVASIGDAVSIVFNHDTTFAEMIRILCYIFSILSILATIYCCYPRFRLWFNGCCFFQKPTKYWRDVKGYKVPEYVSKHKQENDAEKGNDDKENAPPENTLPDLAIEKDITSTNDNKPENHYATIQRDKSNSPIIRPSVPPPPPPTDIPIRLVQSPLPIRPVEAPIAPLSTFTPFPAERFKRLYAPLFVPTNTK